MNNSRKLKILLVTSMPWREDNNIGNSYSNIFKGMDSEVEFAHLYCRAGLPQNNLCHKYFQLNESDLVSNIIRGKQLGEYFELDNPMDTPNESFSKSYNKMRLLRWEIFFLGRNILWKLARWKTERLDNFIEEFKPDIVFATLTYMPNVNELLVYLKNKYDIPLIVYSWDDVFFAKKHTLSPLYWLRRTNQRKWITETMTRIDYMYAISERMKEEYASYFNKPCDILRKGHLFINKPEASIVDSQNIKLIYAGNIGDNRWRVLADLAKAIKSVNNGRRNMTLQIYTLSPISDEMKMALNVENVSTLMGSISPQKVSMVLSEADILVHVESTDKDTLNQNRLSFSTKIVDYLYKGKCVLAIGGKNASMDYLKDNDAAIVIDDIESLSDKLSEIINNTNIISEYGEKAWNCGVKNHDISKIQKMLMERFSAYTEKM